MDIKKLRVTIRRLADESVIRNNPEYQRVLREMFRYLNEEEEYRRKVNGLIWEEKNDKSLST